jgi:phage tail sheath protein FI
MATAPGVYVSVTAAPSSSGSRPPTGTWFVSGQTQAGPTGVAVPITSMSDYAAYLGPRVSYGMLYDSLDEFFHDGGVLAYVSRVVGPAAVAAHITLVDRAGSPLNTLAITAAGAGVWGNDLSVTIAAGSVSNSYTIAVNDVDASTVIVTSPNLLSPADAVTWAASLNVWQSGITITNSGSATTAPNNNPALGTFVLATGADDNAGATDTQWTAALTAFGINLGSGQVSAPGHTSGVGYVSLNAHAVAFNRVPLLDVADSATASTLVTQATTFQSASGVTDPSYGALFGPWVVIPGIPTALPASSAFVPTRAVPPSSFAAAVMAKSDLTNDTNTPAAGPNGVSTYALGVTQTYNQTDRGTLNAAGVNVIRQMPNGVVELYGYRSLALDPAWVFLNNVRFRMQVIDDFDVVGESLVFQEIDGRGHLFARFNSALSGVCQQYWVNNSIYGASAADAFTVNTGPQVNTPTSIAAGQLNAQVSMRMSPAAEVVTITVVKYSAAQTLPTLSA